MFVLYLYLITTLFETSKTSDYSGLHVYLSLFFFSCNLGQLRSYYSQIFGGFSFEGLHQGFLLAKVYVYISELYCLQVHDKN